MTRPFFRENNPIPWTFSDNGKTPLPPSKSAKKRASNQARECCVRINGSSRISGLCVDRKGVVVLVMKIVSLVVGASVVVVAVVVATVMVVA